MTQTDNRDPLDECPDDGDGGDPALNALKNRLPPPLDANYAPIDTPFAFFAQLGPTPNGIARKPRSEWPEIAANAAAAVECLYVAVEGYLAGAHKEGPESCNCHSVDDVDHHMWFVEHYTHERAQSVVAETTPRVRKEHPGWTIEAMQHIARTGQRVRLTGWLLLDQEHPEQIGKTRSTLWEIHPVCRVEVLHADGVTWVDL